MDLNPAHMPPNPPQPAGPPAPSSRPVVKRKRTGGNLGAFKTLPSISNPSSAASRGTPSTAHSSQGIPQGSTNTVPCPPPSASSAPSAPSTARSEDPPHQAVQSKPPQSSTFFGNEQQACQHPESFAQLPNSDITGKGHFFHKAGEQKVPHRPTANISSVFHC